MLEVIEYPRVPDSYQRKIQVKLLWYKKHGDSLVGEESLEGLSLQKLQSIFDVHISNALFNCWHVKRCHAVELQDRVSHRIAVKKFTYFVEQEAAMTRLNLI
jgi:hypothetical protein